MKIIYEIILELRTFPYMEKERFSTLIGIVRNLECSKANGTEFSL